MRGVPGLHREADVLLHGEAREQVGDLERAADPGPGDGVRLQAGDLASVEADAAAARPEHPREQVEGGRLAGAVRSDQGVKRPVGDREGHAAHRLHGPETLPDVVGDQNRAVAAPLRDEAGRDAARGAGATGRHGRTLGRDAPERLHEARRDADQAVRREHDEGDEQQAEVQKPVGGVDRQELAEQDVEQRAQRRSEERAHPADHHHGEQLAREGDGDRVGRGEAVAVGGERARQPGDRRRDHEGGELVAVGGVAEEARALLVLADRHQHGAHRRPAEAPQGDQHREGDAGHRGVVGAGLLQRRPAVQVPDAVLAAGEVGPPERDGVEHRREGERQEREVDAAPPQDQAAGGQGRASGDRQGAEERQRHVAGKEPCLQDRHRVGADPEPRPVAERGEPGPADQDVESQHRQGEDHHVGGGDQRQADRVEGEGQDDQRGERGPELAALAQDQAALRQGERQRLGGSGHGTLSAHSNRAMCSPNRPRGRSSRTSTMRA